MALARTYGGRVGGGGGDGGGDRDGEWGSVRGKVRQPHGEDLEALTPSFPAIQDLGLLFPVFPPYPLLIMNNSFGSGHTGALDSRAGHIWAGI